MNTQTKAPPLPVSPELAARKRQAGRRRRALIAAGCATFALHGVGSKRSITCCCCGIESHNPIDVATRFCGFCSEYGDDWTITPGGGA